MLRYGQRYARRADARVMQFPIARDSVAWNPLQSADADFSVRHGRSRHVHMFVSVPSEAILLYEHMFSSSPHTPPFAQRALGALRLARSFLLLEDDYEVDWEVDQDERADDRLTRRTEPSASGGAARAGWVRGALGSAAEHRCACARRWTGSRRTCRAASLSPETILRGFVARGGASSRNPYAEWA